MPRGRDRRPLAPHCRPTRRSSPAAAPRASSPDRPQPASPPRRPRSARSRPALADHGGKSAAIAAARKRREGGLSRYAGEGAPRARRHLASSNGRSRRKPRPRPRACRAARADAGPARRAQPAVAPLQPAMPSDDWHAPVPRAASDAAVCQDAADRGQRRHHRDRRGADRVRACGPTYPPTPPVSEDAPGGAQAPPQRRAGRCCRLRMPFRRRPSRPLRSPHRARDAAPNDRSSFFDPLMMVPPSRSNRSHRFDRPPAGTGPSLQSASPSISRPPDPGSAPSARRCAPPPPPQPGRGI